jgi:hypothetical protein
MGTADQHWILLEYTTTTGMVIANAISDGFSHHHDISIEDLTVVVVVVMVISRKKQEHTAGFNAMSSH